MEKKHHFPSSSNQALSMAQQMFTLLATKEIFYPEKDTPMQGWQTYECCVRGSGIGSHCVWDMTDWEGNRVED